MGATAPALSGALIILALLGALYAAWPFWRAFLPLEIDPNESWNAYLADDVRAGQPLYRDPTGLVINNYPPLSFLLLGAISRTGIDPLYAGRFLSILAIAATAAAVGSLIRQFQGSFTAAFVGGVWFWATLARFFDTYFVMNDPNLPALAMMMWGLVWFRRRQVQGGRIDPAVALMVIAGFYKHTLFAVPVTAVGWLAISDRRKALRAACLGGILVALGFALCTWAYGPAFLNDLLMPREYSLRAAIGGLGRLQWIAPSLLFVGVWAWCQRHGEDVRFCVLFVAVAFLSYFVQKLGAGVDDNAQFELVAATAVGLGLTFQNISIIPAPAAFTIEAKRFALILVLIARLLISLRTEPYRLIASPDFRAELGERSVIVNSEIARISALPGPVICSTRSICRWAGKPYIYDEFVVAQRITTGVWSLEEVDRRRAALEALWQSIDPRTRAPSYRDRSHSG